MGWRIGTCVGCDDAAWVIGRLLERGKVAPDDARLKRLYKTAGGCWVMVSDDGDWRPLCEIVFQDVPQDGGEGSALNACDLEDPLEGRPVAGLDGDADEPQPPSRGHPRGSAAPAPPTPVGA